MKLQNKKTGEVKPAEAREDGIYLYDVLTEQWYKYELDLLAKWWEYYEEPEMFYIVEQRGMVGSRFRTGDEYEKMFKEIGNYFETKEEAEKVVEKLKAWKRLKDKKFEFTEWYKPDGCEPYIVIKTNIGYDDVDNMELQKDLDLLFEGER